MKGLWAVLMVLLFSVSGHAGVVSEPLEYSHGDTVLEGYLAYDDAVSGKRPGVLVVHEWWGLNDYAKKRTHQLAELGYVAFAVDMYGKGVVTDDPKEASKWSSRFKGKPLMRERVRAGLEVLKARDEVDPERIGAIGFCFGGTTVLELAYSGAEVAGVVSFHGGLTTPKVEDMEGIQAKILVLHGAADPFVSSEAVTAFQDSMHKAGVDWQMIYYGGAVHSFTNPEADKAGMEGVAYDADAARRSWKHMQVFFEEILR
jgi:dienelactone hydrolase